MLIDDLLKKYPDLQKPNAIFKIQNIRDYYAYTWFDEKGENSLSLSRDVFSFLPPFPNTYFEYKFTPRITNGIFVRETTLIEQQKHIFFEVYNQEGLLAKRLLLCNKQGKVIPHPEGTKDITIYKSSETVPDEEYVSWLETSLTIVCLALNFLHCKNVLAVENPFNKKIIKARRARNKPYFEKYYSLEIEPIKKILSNEGQIEKVGLRQALHICRGHFRTYGGKGLFGKYPGVFWCPAHTKGDTKKGIIKKDYIISPIAKKKTNYEHS